MPDPPPATPASTKANALAALRRAKIAPVFRSSFPEQGLTAAEGLYRAGCPVLEVTLTVPRAIELIHDLSHRYEGKIAIGAGTVLDPGACREAIDAGAQFIVSPSCEVPVIEVARALDTLCIPGALTPTEIVTAHRAGADLIKIFPCGAMGGPRYLRALAGPFPDLQFLPSGGVNFDNAREHIEAGAVAVAVGELIFSVPALQAGDVDTVAANARRFMAACN